MDDHSIVRDGLRMRVSTERDLEVCGEAATEDEAIVLVKESLPDLVIVDLSLKIGHGLELVKRIKSRFPGVKTLVFSTYPESQYAERALRAGALGYLNKEAPNDTVLEAIRTVLAGERFISREITQRLIGHSLGHGDPTKTPTERLTDRELEVFRLIGEGHTSGAIANRLLVSRHTIDTHRENIKRKLCLKNAGALSRAAVQWTMENS